MEQAVGTDHILSLGYVYISFTSIDFLYFHLRILPVTMTHHCFPHLNTNHKIQSYVNYDPEVYTDHRAMPVSQALSLLPSITGHRLLSLLTLPPLLFSVIFLD